MGCVSCTLELLQVYPDVLEFGKVYLANGCPLDTRLKFTRSASDLVHGLCMSGQQVMCIDMNTDLQHSVGSDLLQV